MTHHLQPQTLLRGKYMIGGVIGEGGFGISYVGSDITSHLKVAIKEYYPSGFATRNESSQVRAYGKERSKYFEDGRKRFIEEAQCLARFYYLPGIVSVKDFFSENGTAYIVMEFVEGASLRVVLESMGGRMREADVLKVMKPLIDSMADLHKQGIIHRDIAPDNIMVQPDGSVKLLDFGAARAIVAGDKSSVAILKRGYAPEEQYDSNRKRQGAWTDVYAMCATIFRAIEGTTPLDAVSRMRSDTFAGFVSADVSENTRNVIMKGLALAPKDRWQSMEQLSNMLYPQSNKTAVKSPVAVKSFISAAQSAVSSLFTDFRGRFARPQTPPAPAQSCPAGIRGVAGQYNSMSFPIDAAIAIGRNPALCNILYSPDSVGISSLHCEIIRAGDVLRITDKGSTCGTFVQNQKLAANVPVQLSKGDIICLADDSNSFVVY